MASECARKACENEGKVPMHGPAAPKRGEKRKLKEPALGPGSLSIVGGLRIKAAQY